jgi:asparagine synthase (glutamine-hydrolysing)
MNARISLSTYEFYSARLIRHAALRLLKQGCSVKRMCGLAGIYARPDERPGRQLLLSMAGELRHRGPEGTGLYLDERLGMVATRLAIVDLDHGDQPLSDERGRHWVMQNGEIYNYVELRAELQALGHVFETRSDTEVIAHAYEQWGAECLQRLNGDFALAIWNRERRELFLARDRFGVRPLFLAELGGDFCFASEAKALLRHPRALRELDPDAVVETFTLWSTLPDRSAFKGIRELPPAHHLLIGPDGPGRMTRWWDLDYTPDLRPEKELLDELDELLVDATRIRLRADVPVAAYMSGGLDSSALAAIATREVGSQLSAFGLGFADERFDESRYQDEVARHLGLDFRRTVVDAEAIAQLLPRAVELGEKPLLRTAPAPLLRLSETVSDTGLKVVLTGEGADELFAGYDIFREDKVRRFWARDPSSALRPLLFARLNRFLGTDLRRAGGFVAGFYGRDLLNEKDPLYSHRIRFLNTSRCLRMLNRDFVAGSTREPDVTARLVERLPAGFADWTSLSRAQYIEIATFFEGYLLHGQGDRILMGHSVEGRFPYLDFRVAELSAKLPDSLRLRGLQEKYALHRIVAPRLPEQIVRRAKQPYRAPIGSVLGGPAAPEYVRELLARPQLEQAGLLDTTAVARLVSKFERTVGETDEMALVGAVTLMLLHDRFVENPRVALPLEPDRLVVGSEIISARAEVA